MDHSPPSDKKVRFSDSQGKRSSSQTSSLHIIDFQEAKQSTSTNNDAVKDSPENTPVPERGHGSSAKMADPFEVRMRFTSMLQHLNASVTSSQKAAHYALRYRDMDEDLHSCILEQLERNSMNNRANIMYFIEHLCDHANRENHQDYIRMMQRDILRIVDAVTPEDGSGAANIKVVRKVLQALQNKTYLLAQTVMEIEECLRERDTAPDHAGLSSPTQAPDVDMGNTSFAAGTPRRVKLDKKQIEQRIEEDRERHKRAREGIWSVPPGQDEEFEKMMDETSELGEDDYIIFEEEAAERRKAAEEHRDEYATLPAVNAEKADAGS